MKKKGKLFLIIAACLLICSCETEDPQLKRLRELNIRLTVDNIVLKYENLRLKEEMVRLLKEQNGTHIKP